MKTSTFALAVTLCQIPEPSAQDHARKPNLPDQRHAGTMSLNCNRYAMAQILCRD